MNWSMEEVADELRALSLEELQETTKRAQLRFVKLNQQRRLFAQKTVDWFYDYARLCERLLEQRVVQGRVDPTCPECLDGAECRRHGA